VICVSVLELFFLLHFCTKYACFLIPPDRCHRIGQTKKVTVIKMVTKDTVDSDIYNMQERKSKMNAAIMDSTNAEKKEKKELLKIALNRFLGSAKKAKPGRARDSSNKENSENEDVICLI
jgi:hypothetical protein